MTDFESDRIRQKILLHPQYSTLKSAIEKIHDDLTSPIQKVQPPDPTKKTEYESYIKQFESERGTDLFYPFIGSGLGNGAYVLLEDGSVKLDFIGGIGANYWGHNPKDYLTTAIEVLFTDTIMQGNLQPNRSSTDIIHKLLSLSRFDHAFITTSGTMAGENALKILFQKAFPKARVFAFEHAFAGRSLAMSQINDKAIYKKNLPNLLLVDYLPFYDEKIGVEKSLQNTLEKIDMFLNQYPESHAALLVELVQGEGGFHIGHPVYFQKLFQELKKRQIYIWVDEVQTFGRTESLFAADTFHVMEYIDVLTIGKASQLCATLFRNYLKPLPGLISQTFTASSSAIAAALWGIEKAIHEGHYGKNGKIQTLFTYFSSSLEKLKERTGNAISGPWGIGSMVSFTPFDGIEDETKRFAKELFQNGLIGFTCGSNPTKIRFLLPVGAITSSHIDEAISIIEKTVRGFKKT